MAVSDEYVAYLADLYEGKFNLSFKKMFGGRGVYANGLSIGVIAEDVFYAKTDEESRAAYEQEGSEPFVYTAKGVQRVIKAWYRMPDMVFEDSALFTEWVDRCYAVAVAAAKLKEAKKTKSRRQPGNSKQKSTTSKHKA